MKKYNNINATVDYSSRHRIADTQIRQHYTGWSPGLTGTGTGLTSTFENFSAHTLEQQGTLRNKRSTSLPLKIPNLISIKVNTPSMIKLIIFNTNKKSY